MPDPDPFTSFAVRSPAVIHETFEDEVVIVNLDSGDYYSLTEAGATCWKGILQGKTVEQIVAVLASSYDASEETIRMAVADLFSKLLSESLIVASERTSRPVNGQVINRSEERKEFKPPRLNSYSDMRDLLLIDPIHDVDDETGWPTAKPESDKE